MTSKSVPVNKHPQDASHTLNPKLHMPALHTHDMLLRGKKKRTMRKARANSATISLTSPRGPSALCCMDDEMSLPILRTSYCNLCLQQQPRKRVKENKAAGQATPCHTILARTPRRVQCFTKKKKREAPRSRMQSVSGCM